MEIGRAYGLGEILKSSYVEQATKDWDHLLLKKLIPRDTK